MAVRVVLIMGAQRSGSTLVATLLGMVPGAWMAGELALLWSSLVESRPCACLRPCAECPFWREVLDRTSKDPGLSGRTAEDLSAMMQTEVRIRKLAQLLAHSSPPDGELAILATATRRLYESLTAVSGAEVIIDSSKSPAVAAFLRQVDQLDLRVVHLVRDPRGVVDSWSREKTWVRDDWGEALYPKPASVATLGWAGMNGAAEAVRLVLGKDRTRRLRFEDFLADPDASLRSLVELAGLPQPSEDEMPLEDGAAIVRENHAIGGNVDRFDVGKVPLRTGEGWRRRLSPRTQRAVTAATLPLMRRYGYC